MRQLITSFYLFLCLFLAGLCSAQIIIPQLELKSLVLKDGTKIDFSSTMTDHDTSNAVVLLSETENFQVWAGPTPCEYIDEYRFFRYKLFVKERASGQWFCFLLNAAPYGPFLDRFEEIPYTIHYSNTIESRELRLPLHSLSAGQYLDSMLIQGKDDVPLDNAIFDVRLGSDRTIPLVFKNRLDDMKLIVRSVQLSYFQPEYWASNDTAFEQEMKIAEGARAFLNNLKVRARPIKVVPNMFFRLKGGEDTRLKLTINYEAQGGGKPKELDAVIRIRFVPSLPYLALAILVGGVLGATGRLIDRKARVPIIDWLKGLGIVILTAVILEIIGIVLASLDSEFKIFGLVLDPFQFPHVMVMAMLVGALGIDIQRIITQVLGLN